MATVLEPTVMTTAELLATDDESRLERWLIRGELREREMTKRNRRHSRITIRIGRFLDEWLDLQPLPRGEVVGGEAGFILERDPDTTVGIDVAYAGPNLANQPGSNSTLFDGPPILAVEMLSPSDRLEDVQEKITEYLRCGVKLVWIVDPRFETITVHRPDAEPVLFNRLQTISADPELPGFSVPVAEVFR
jgi:Uma2 family endonuclease